MKGLDQIRTLNGKDDKYSHLTDEEVKRVEKAVQEKWTWLEEKRVLLAGLLRTQQPPVVVAQIRAEKQVNIERKSVTMIKQLFLCYNMRLFIFDFNIGIGQCGTTHSQQA